MRLDIEVLKAFFPSLIFSAPGESIHLTFDDGPHPSGTNKILNILRDYNINATFFLIGKNVQRYQELTRLIKTEGHQICNHSYSHENLFFKKKTAIERSILKTEAAIKEAAGINSDYFRPPYGYISPAILEAAKGMGLKCVLWNIDSKDYIRRKQRYILARLSGKVKKGSILLFHDNEATSGSVENYLPSMIEKLLKDGFEFEKLST